MSGNRPLISILMPAYNHERFVQEAIRSIINQTYQNLELIIIDDGSTDSTWAKIQEMKADCEKRFVRADFSTQENQGICETENKLISKTQGEYIYMIASDDIAKPQAIETLHKSLSEKKYVLAVGNEDFIDSNSEKIGIDEKFQHQSLVNAKYKTFCDYYSGEAGINYKSKNFGCYASFLKRNYIPNGLLILSSALKQFKYNAEAPLEDWYMHMQLSKIGRYKFVDEVLFSYRLHRNNTIEDKQYLWKMSQKTIEYEERLSLSNPKLRKLFIQATISKIYLNLGFIQIYKRKFFGKKSYCLNLFGKEFILKEKNIP
ncbi:MAG: glycosyltransferase family 2 protein [Alphaproteobacteria bacterium]|nr:glycosyltransferase family 2 protein [Alphaproteobacteria bacterium]